MASMLINQGVKAEASWQRLKAARIQNIPYFFIQQKKTKPEANDLLVVFGKEE